MTCTLCKGGGYGESPAYYYGRAECPRCEGLGELKIDGEPFTEVEWEAHIAEPEPGDCGMCMKEPNAENRS